MIENQEMQKFRVASNNINTNVMRNQFDILLLTKMTTIYEPF
jgi:hypothetical protein